MSNNKASRRVILKAVASFPLAFTLGIPLSAKAFKKAKPFAQTLQAEDCSTSADASVAGPIAKFSESAFPQAWSYVFFEVTRDGKAMPGYLVKLPDGDFVAYSSTCPELGCKFKLLTDVQAACERFGIAVSQPVLACDCHGNAFTIDPLAKRVAGPERKAPEQMPIKRCHDKICVLA